MLLLLLLWASKKPPTQLCKEFLLFLTHFSPLPSTRFFFRATDFSYTVFPSSSPHSPNESHPCARWTLEKALREVLKNFSASLVPTKWLTTMSFLLFSAALGENSIFLSTFPAYSTNDYWPIKINIISCAPPQNSSIREVRRIARDVLNFKSSNDRKNSKNFFVCAREEKCVRRRKNRSDFDPIAGNFEC